MRNPEVAQAIDSVQKAIRAEVEQELKQQLYTELLTVQRKRELLARIANGQLFAVQQYKGKDCRTCEQIVTPTINQMLKAIDLDNKLAGHYTLKTVDSSLFTVNNSPALHKQVDEFTQQFSETVQLQQKTTNNRESETEQKAPLLTKAECPDPSWKGTNANRLRCLHLGEVNPRRTDNTTKLVPREPTTRETAPKDRDENTSYLAVTGEKHNKTQQIPIVRDEENTGIRKNA